jgi:hypothetical protein
MDRAMFLRCWFALVAVGAVLPISGCVPVAGPSRVPGVGLLARPPVVGARGDGVEKPVSPPLVELRCVRGPGGHEQVSLRSRCRQPLDVDLLGLAYAGQGMWEHWWTQHDIHLAPGGSWEAALYEVRWEKLEVRDRRGRLLAAFNAMRDLPPFPWAALFALGARRDWQPFGPPLAGGPGGAPVQRTLLPADLPASKDELGLLRIRVIGDLPATALRREQVDVLHGAVESGRIMMISGGADRDRVRSWERAGLLAAPVRGQRRLDGLPTLARRYGVAPLAGPIPIADVGPVAPPARVLLEEGGVPILVERPLGLGTLLFLAFDPTRAPFRGSALERAFWQEWGTRREEHPIDAYLFVDERESFQALQRRVGLQPPSAGVLVAVWLGYALTVAAVLICARRRLRALLLLSLGGSLGALALGPTLRGGSPRMAFAGQLTLRSGQGNGRWWGSAQVMAARDGLITLRAPEGRADIGQAPRLRLPSSATIFEEPLLRRWMSERVGVMTPGRLPGAVDLELELRENGAYARARNRTPYRLEDATLVWDRMASLRLGTLAPGQEKALLLGRVGVDGSVVGVKEPIPAEFRSRYPRSDEPENYPAPLLLARCPSAAAPTLLLDERRVETASLKFLVVGTVGWRARGAFRLPVGAVESEMVRARGWRGIWMPGAGDRRFDLEPESAATLEFRLPMGSGQARWRRLELRVGRNAAWPLRLWAFDWQRQDWAPVAAFAARSLPQPPARYFRQWTPPALQSLPQASVALPSPGRFVNRHNDVLLLRVESPGTARTSVAVEVRGHGQAG